MCSSRRMGGGLLQPGLFFSALVLALLLALPASANSFRSWWQEILQNFLAANDVQSYEWELINEDSEWSPRAGLQVVDLGHDFYLMGGRTPNPPPAKVRPPHGGARLSLQHFSRPQGRLQTSSRL